MTDSKQTELFPQLSLEVFHAKTCAEQTPKEKDSRENGQDCSTKSQDWFAKYDRNTASWRMSQDCCEATCIESLPSLPRSGTMKSNGTVSQLHTWAVHTKEIEYGSLRVKFPTPNATDCQGGIHHDTQYKNGSFFRVNKKGIRWGVQLRDAVNHLEKMKHQSSEESSRATFGKLNPALVEFLMGFPSGWSELRA